MPEVSPERSAWRDLDFSEHHRKWGWDCPAVDIDFLMIEYDRAKPIALVEYKHERAKPADPKSTTYRAIKTLSDLAGIPFFGVRYTSDFKKFTVARLNKKAEALLTARQVMTELEYVQFLYRLRWRKVPTDIIDFIKSR